jgi:hypothetical protein
MKKLVFLLSICFFIATPLYAGKNDPTAVLFQAKGNVEYTKNGKSWRKVRRNKFLFDGYQVRTGSDGSGKVTIKETGENFDLTSNSLFDVTDEGLVAVQGSISAAESSGKLVSGLIKKFDKSQSYTTVRRSFNKREVKLEAVRDVTVSDDYPYLVWNNLGDDYDYKVVVGGKSYDVPSSDEMYVRVKLDPFEGQKAFDIYAVKDGNTVTQLGKYRSRGEDKDHMVNWLSGTEKNTVEEEVKAIQDTYGENSFMLGSYFEKKDMWVASMEQYKQYLQENPDEIEMTPYLFRVYKKLQLDDVYKKELEEWKQAMIE